MRWKIRSIPHSPAYRPVPSVNRWTRAGSVGRCRSGLLPAGPCNWCRLDRLDPGLECVAKANGFSLHAGVSCEGHQKDKRERLCRYIARPAVAVPRLSLSSTGKVVYTLKTTLPVERPRWPSTGAAVHCRFRRAAGSSTAQTPSEPYSVSWGTRLRGPAQTTDGAGWSPRPDEVEASGLSPMRKLIHLLEAGEQYVSN